ncbi:hypothetical protein [Bradyrhizobium sp. B120]|uniref:hypothetical protein n=1 Tax=Bradyrhizobium sp. B120 TaxID=3410088 RepID=UPI003B9805E7
MSKIVKVVGQNWQMIDGALCVVFIGRDSLRRDVMVAVPAAAIFPTIASEARRRIAATQKEGAHVNVPGTWNQVRFLRAETMQVGTTDQNQVGLIFDPGAETEFALSIAPEHARQLGQRLIDEAAKATGLAPTVN